MHRVVDYCSDRAWIVVAAIILSVLVYVGIGRQLAANVHYYKTDIEQLIERNTGLHAEIDTLHCGWTFFSPLFELKNIRLYAPGNLSSPVLSARSINVEPDVLASLLVFEPRLINLHVDGLKVNLHRDDAGRYGLPGMVSNSTQSAMSNNLLALTLRQSLLSLTDSAFTLTSTSDEPIEVSNLNIQLKRLSEFYQASLTTDMDGQALKIVVEAYGNPFNKQNTVIQLYAKLASGELLRWLPRRLIEKVESKASIQLDEWVAGAEFWGSLEEGRLSELRGVLESKLLKVSSTRTDEKLDIQKLFSRFQLSLSQQYNVALQFDGLQFYLGDEFWPDSRLRVNVSETLESVDVVMDKAVVSILSELALFTEALPDASHEILAALDAEGMLHNFSLHVEKESDDPFVLNSGFSSLGINQWGKVPGMSGVSGALRMTASEGAVFLDSQNLQFFSEAYFRRPLHLDFLTGPVSWLINADSEIRVKSGKLALGSNDMSLDTFLSIYVPVTSTASSDNEAASAETDELKEETDVRDDYFLPQLFLTAHFNESAAQFISQYLPPKLSDNLLSWLDNGLLDGSVTGDLLYHGQLNWRNPLAHTLQVNVLFDDVVLDYMPGEWPMLTDLNGEMFIDDGEVSFSVNDGKIMQADINALKGSVGVTPAWPETHLEFSGSLKGSMTDSLRVLNETPLKEVIDGAAEDWRGEGRVSAQLAMEVPLETSKRETDVKLKMHFYQADLALPAYDLNFLKITGDLNYTSEQGLFSHNLRAELFDYPAAIIIPEVSEDDVLFQLLIDSQIQLSTLATWSRQPLISFAQGRAAYHGDLVLKSGQKGINPLSPAVAHQAPLNDPKENEVSSSPVLVYLNIESDTSGVRFNFPSPISKARDQSRPLKFSMVSQGDVNQYNITQDGIFDAHLSLRQGSADEIRLALGSAHTALKDKGGVTVLGVLDTFDWNEWEPFLLELTQRYEKLDESVLAAGEQTSSSESVSFIETINSIDLDIKHFAGFGMDIDEMNAHLIRDDRSWLLGADSPALKGEFKIPDDKRPIEAGLAYLYLVDDEEEIPVPAESGSAIELEAGDFPAVKGIIDHFQYGDMKLGRWHFKGKPVNNSYHIESLNIQLGSLSVAAQGQWGGQGEANNTRLIGTAKTENVGELMSIWGQEATIISRKGRMNFDMSWPFSPVDFELNKISGKMDIKIDDGRFLDVGAASALRVLGILNFANIGRRLKLDFGDLLKSGHSFDDITGDMILTQGVLNVHRLDIKSPSSSMHVFGDMDFNNDELDMRMDVELEISKNLVAIAAIVGGPAAGGGMFLIDRLIGDRLAKIATLKYVLKGTVSEPVIKIK